MSEAIKNADRFLGFADTYEEARPQMPLYTIEVIQKYLGRKPNTVVDIGCGTGLSTSIWENQCAKAIGVEPSKDMLSVALKKQTANISFIKAFSHETGLPDCFADAVVCSQSFHWMEPQQTLAEVNRILKPNGIFATVDCDWPPVCNWIDEKAYQTLFNQVNIVEEENPKLKDSFKRWDKNQHLNNISNSGFFRYTREIVFANREKCNADRFIKLALSQGGLQSILKSNPELILKQVEEFKEIINNTLVQDFDIDFCYRMRIGVK